MAWLLPVIAPFMVMLAVFLLIFGFVYFSLFMIPKYIAEGSGAPGVIYNWGNKDIWSLERDIKLIDKYKDLDYSWLNQFEDAETLAGEKPDTISGNGADSNATVGKIWGSYMAVNLVTPNLSTNNKFDSIFQDKAEKYSLEPELLKALAWAESSFDPEAVSSKDCKGLMQLSPAKIKEYGIKDPFDPEENIDGGARYLKELLDRFDSIELAIAAYNAGPDAVERYGGIPPYPETQNHVRKVMAAYRGGQMAVPVLEKGSNIVAEREQVEPHRVPWALLGALDRVLGDPIVHGRHGPETEEGRGRTPEPEKHFTELEPELEWQNFQLYYYHRWTEYEYEDGKRVAKTYTEKYTHNIRLLTYADTYEAKHHYQWDQKVIEEEDEDSYTKIIVPQLVDYYKEGPYYERLKNLLASYGLTKDIEFELVLRLAMNIDDNYYVDANLTSSPLEITDSTETGYYEGSGELAWPLRGPIKSPFGYRVHPITKEYRLHTGIDIACPRGAEVHSAGDGIVIFVGNNGAYGKCIIIDHGKYRTLYGHLLSYKVKPGDEVEKGQVIAKADSTGWSTGDHLHFEVRAGKNKTQFIDPLTVLN
jgi:murein DD-endopeptidase MepM/ murein hydrolase activator NlpD